MKISFFKAISFGLLCSLLITTSCSFFSNKDQAENTIALPVVEVDTGTVELTETFLGTVRGKTNIDVRPQVSGELVQAFVDEGDRVEKGEKLFKVNPQTFQQNLNQAIANKNEQEVMVESANMEVERLKPLVEHEVYAPIRIETERKKYEIAQANLEQAKAEVENAKIQLGYTTLKAPVSGYIGQINKRIGNLVSSGDDEPITTLTDVDEVYVYFSISESNFYSLLKEENGGLTDPTSDAEHIDTDQTVSFTLPDGTLYPYQGVIDASSGQVNENTGSIMMRATFPNEGNMLRSGNTGTLIMTKKNHGEILIPSKATYELQTETFVKMLTPDNRVVRQSIQVGTEAPNNRYTIVGGLQKGDRILVEGLEQATDSMKIKPLPYQADTLERPKVFPEDYDSSVQDSDATAIDSL